MNIREQTEQIESMILADWATKSVSSKGREREDPEDAMRTCFQRDRDRILHSKSFRRLKQKTQVFLSPEGDLYRTRLTHTLEVSQIARTMSRALRLNEDLTEAIALGHDLGHTPFGHAGESALDDVYPDGFAHHEQSVRVVERIEKYLLGLNLTKEVRDGIYYHSSGAGNAQASTPEGRIVRFADKIAFICHDIEDAIRAGVITEDDLPAEPISVLGHTKSERIASMVGGVITASSEAHDILMSSDIFEPYNELKAWMYKNVYLGGKAKVEEKKAKELVKALYEYYTNWDNAGRLPVIYQTIAKEEGIERAAVDYIAGMGDDYAIRTFSELFVPQKWHVL